MYKKILLISVAVVSTITTPLLAAECSKLGSPSYSANRVVRIGPVTIRSKVFVSGKKVREEVKRGPNIEVVLQTGRGIVVFIEKRNEGFRIPRPPRPKKRGESRIDRKKVGGNIQYTHLLKSDKGHWFTDVVVLCSPSGVLLKRKSQTLIRGKTATTTMSQSGIRIGRQPSTLFVVPKGVKIK